MRIELTGFNPLHFLLGPTFTNLEDRGRSKVFIEIMREAGVHIETNEELSICVTEYAKVVDKHIEQLKEYNGRQ